VYANDRPDLAILAGCEGVHVGQSDVSVSDIRRLGRQLQVGLSTADTAQLCDALESAPDYIAVGPVFATRSKADAEPAVGLEFLATAFQATSQKGIPLVAIGGVDHARAAEIAQAASLGAAISALFPADRRLVQVTTLARRLHEALGGN
jgi:thiamine-phosphate pyrophosphorylase